MRVLGITLGHDASFALVEGDRLVGLVQAERWFRQKHYKLHCLSLEPGKHPSGFQYVDIAELELFLARIAELWGTDYDAVAVQNQGRADEYANLLVLLERQGFRYRAAEHLNHHLCHAALAFYTSPFDQALVLSYDGGGNDGFTVFFDADGDGIRYVDTVDIRLGSSYNNLGYIAGVKPDISGTSSGKTMGLAAYGDVRDEWLPQARRYVREYRRRPSLPTADITPYGGNHRIAAVGLEDIPELKPYLVPLADANRPRSLVRRALRRDSGLELRLPGPEDGLTQDLVHTVQAAWTAEAIELVRARTHRSRNLCVVGGCALNGMTNYAIQERGLFDGTFFVPNPTDDGLSAGAALYLSHKLRGARFAGSDAYNTPYLGPPPFDLNELPALKARYPHRHLAVGDLPRTLARLVYEERIVGVITGGCEVGPRALGNRSILCTSLHPQMKKLLNERVKHREWYRPFAPVAPAEDAQRYFTNLAEIPYMSVICHTRPEWRDRLPSVTHVDGTTRLQTVQRDQHRLLYETLKEFERLSGVPVMLNTSFNPGGEPILNYCGVGLEMLNTTDLDLVLIEETLFCKPARQAILDECMP